ncbi:MAG: hypothetical protein AAB455_01200 [Patescibacteria group bacterium]
MNVYQMNVYQEISAALAILLYIPLAWQILTGRVKQNLATWILWWMLDGLAALSMFFQDGNWYLPAAYVAGCTLIIGCMVRAKNLAWTNFETVVSMMVLVCLIGWATSGPWLATILSTLGVFLAGLAQLKDAWRSPKEMPVLLYFGYFAVNVISMIGGKGWTVEERLYPGACAVLCGAITLASCRKFF